MTAKPKKAAEAAPVVDAAQDAANVAHLRAKLGIKPEDSLPAKGAVAYAVVACRRESFRDGSHSPACVCKGVGFVRIDVERCPVLA